MQDDRENIFDKILIWNVIQYKMNVRNWPLKLHDKWMIVMKSSLK